VSYRGGGTVRGPLRFTGTASPGLSSAGEGRIYFDSGSNVFKASENGGAYVTLVGGGGGGTLQTDYTAGGAGGGAILLTLAGGPIAITNPAATAQSGLTVVQNTAGQFAADFTGPVRVTGKLTVTGAIDPPSITLSGGTALFFESGDGSTAPVAGASSGRIRYNNGTGRWELSTQGTAYVQIPTGPGSSAVVQARRTTTFSANTTPTDVTLDTNDVQSNAAVVTHSTVTNTARITALVPGTFTFSYFIPGTAASIVQGQGFKNGTTVVPGSAASAASTGTDLYYSFSVTLAANDFVTVQASVAAGTGTVPAGIVFSGSLFAAATTGVSLQSSYNNGNTILLAGAAPVQITNPAASATTALRIIQNTSGQNSITATGGPISSQGQSGSEQFGTGASSNPDPTGLNNTAVGASATVAFTVGAAGNTVVGQAATASSIDSLVMGRAASTTSFPSNAVVLGVLATSNSTGSIAIGQSATVNSSADSVVIGRAATDTPAFLGHNVLIGATATAAIGAAVVIGFGASVTGFSAGAVAVGAASTAASGGTAVGTSSTAGLNSIAIGSSSVAASGQLVAGSSTAYIGSVFFGRGVSDSSGSAVDCTIFGTNSTVGVGATVTLAAGQGTTGGELHFDTDPTSTGRLTRLKISADGATEFETVSPAPALSPAGTARFYYDSGLNKLRISENGGAYFTLFQGNLTLQTAYSNGPNVVVTPGTPSAWTVSTNTLISLTQTSGASTLAPLTVTGVGTGPGALFTSPTGISSTRTGVAGSEQYGAGSIASGVNSLAVGRLAVANAASMILIAAGTGVGSTATANQITIQVGGVAVGPITIGNSAVAGTGSGITIGAGASGGLGAAVGVGASAVNASDLAIGPSSSAINGTSFAAMGFATNAANSAGFGGAGSTISIFYPGGNGATNAAPAGVTICTTSATGAATGAPMTVTAGGSVSGVTGSTTITTPNSSATSGSTTISTGNSGTTPGIIRVTGGDKPTGTTPLEEIVVTGSKVSSGAPATVAPGSVDISAGTANAGNTGVANSYVSISVATTTAPTVKTKALTVQGGTGQISIVNDLVPVTPGTGNVGTPSSLFDAGNWNLTNSLKYRFRPTGSTLTAASTLTTPGYYTGDTSAGSFITTLPLSTSLSLGDRLLFKKIEAAANLWQLSGQGGDLIDGSGTFNMNDSRGAVGLIARPGVGFDIAYSF